MASYQYPRGFQPKIPEPQPIPEHKEEEHHDEKSGWEIAGDLIAGGYAAYQIYDNYFTPGGVGRMFLNNLINPQPVGGLGGPNPIEEELLLPIEEFIGETVGETAGVEAAATIGEALAIVGEAGTLAPFVFI